jgi:hypothetical protein
MLISLYFPELNSAFQRVLKSLDHLNEIRQMQSEPMKEEKTIRSSQKSFQANCGSSAMQRKP